MSTQSWQKHTTSYMGSDLIKYRLVDSTNDVARRYPPRTTVLADAQSNGRGRHGRLWDSAQGAGVYVSMHVSPIADSRLPVCVAAMCHSVLSDYVSCTLYTKWPNDILDRQHKKLAGILIEQTQQQLIIGIGINITEQSAHDRTSLLQLGATVLPYTRYMIVHRLTQHMHDLPTSSIAQQHWLDHWQQHCIHQTGTAVQLTQADGTKQHGLYKGLATDGQVVLEIDGRDVYCCTGLLLASTSVEATMD